MMSSTSNTSGMNAGLEPDLIVHQCQTSLLPLLMLWRLKRTDLCQGASPDVKAKPRRAKGITAVKKIHPLLLSTSFERTLVCAWIFSLRLSLFCACPSRFCSVFLIWVICHVFHLSQNQAGPSSPSGNLCGSCGHWSSTTRCRWRIQEEPPARLW